MASFSFIQGAKYLWKVPAANNQLIADIAAQYNISFPVAQTLITRGFSTKESISSFLFSSFEQDVPHTSSMKDAQKAVDRILYAITHKEPILVSGDYDVDGITSSAMMMICLLPLGANINFFLPHRVRDGYGLSTRIVERAAKNGYKVLITVDNGITAFEPALKAKELGIDLIITDHHKPHAHLPDAYAIVNPNQDDCAYPFKVLAGVGVTFKILSLLYEQKGLSLPIKAYELLLLGTVADVVPLLGENRFWVRYGLAQVNACESLSFKTLKINGKLDQPRVSATDIGFSITPQINALGRLEDSRQAVKFLIGADSKEVAEVGKVLLELNEARKLIERTIYNDIVSRVDRKIIDIEKENIVIATDKQWPPGVIGLVASRIVGAYGKPTILFHETEQGIVKGSCRSIPEFNMFNALQSCSSLILQFGGHAQAAGLAVEKSKLPILKERLEALITEQLTPIDLQQKIALDAQATLSDFTKKFVQDLVHLEPFGHHNPMPLFYIKNVTQVQKPSLLKDAHVKCSIFADGVIKPLIFFNRPDLFDTLHELGHRPFSVAGQVKENHWNGRSSIELTGIDIAIEYE